jgi:putative ABC transport system permease protein
MLLNFKVLSKYNLIDLINSEKNNEKLKKANIVLSVLLFVISIICLSIAYKLILENQLVNISNNKFKISIALGIVGTLLFFRALAGFLIKATQSSKNYYLKNLNAFTLRQLNSKINTHYISLSIICIMLFVAIGMSSSAISIKNAIEETSKIQTPYDMTIIKDTNDDNKDLSESLKGLGMDINKYSDEFVNYKLYDSNVEFSSMFKHTNDNYLKQQMKILEKFNNPIMKLSSYNKLREMQGKEKVQIKEKEVVLLTDMNQLKPAIEEYIKENDNIKIGKEDFKICKDYEYMPIETANMGMNFVVFIIDDKYVENFNEIRNYVSLNYNGDKDDIENKIVNEFENLERDSKQYDESGISPYSRTMAFENNMGISSVFLYVGIYIGVVFLISSAAVLALSQLSGANESLGRYKVLKKLGVSTTMINKSIFIQILLYFILPISLALVHSIFGIKVANNVVAVFGVYDTVGNNMFVIGTILLVYTVYFVMTYKNYKRIVNK